MELQVVGDTGGGRWRAESKMRQRQAGGEEGNFNSIYLWISSNKYDIHHFYTRLIMQIVWLNGCRTGFYVV